MKNYLLGNRLFYLKLYSKKTGFQGSEFYIEQIKIQTGLTKVDC